MLLIAPRYTLMKFLAKSLLTCVAIFVLAFQTLAQDSVWVSYFGSGMKALEQGNYQEAERLFTAALDEAEKAAQAKNPHATGMISDSLSGLASALRGQSKYSEAEKVIRRQLQLLETMSGESDPDYSKTLNNLGLLLSDQKQYKEAEEIHRRALILREKYDEPPRRNLAVSLLNLGKVYYEEGKTSESEALFNQARAIFKSIPRDDITPEDIDSILRCDGNLALIYMDEKRYAEAERYYKGIILVSEKLKGVNHPDLISYLENYAKLLRITKRPREAVKLEARIRFIKSGKR